MFSTPLIWFSSGAATVCSSTVADAPGYTARTVTTGGAISGYCAIGSTRIAARPAITMKIDSTAAKIGRSMKKRDIMRGSLLGVGQRLLLPLGRRLVAGLAALGGRLAPLVALALGRRGAVGDLHRPARWPHQL